MGKSNLNKGINNVAFGLLNQFVTIALGIFLPRIVLVSLGSEANGLLNSINQVLIYLALLEGGVGLTITKALYGPVAQKDKPEINGIMSAANIFYRKVGVMYFIGVILVSIIYPVIIKTAMSYWTVATVILLTGLPQVINFLFQGKYRNLIQVEGRKYVLTNLTTVIFLGTSIGKIVLLLNGFGVVSLQAMYLFFNLIQMFFIIWYVKKLFPWLNVNAEPMNDKIGKRKSVFLHQIAGFIFSNTDMLLLSFCGLKVVSVYAIYNMFFTMINSLISNFTGSFTFIMGQKFNSDKKEFMKLQNVFETCNMMLVFSMYFVLYMCILPFLKLYTAGITDISYIDKYLPVLFVIIQLIQSGRLSSMKIIEYAGEFEKTQWHAVLEAALNIAVSVIGVIKFGIYGVLLGTIVSLLVRSVLMIYYAHKKILKVSQKTIYKKWFFNIALMVIMCALASRVNVQPDTYFSVIIYAAVLLVISVSAFAALSFAIDKETFLFIRQEIKKRLGKGKTSKSI